MKMACLKSIMLGHLGLAEILTEQPPETMATAVEGGCDLTGAAAVCNGAGEAPASSRSSVLWLSHKWPGSGRPRCRVAEREGWGSGILAVEAGERVVRHTAKCPGADGSKRKQVARRKRETYQPWTRDPISYFSTTRLRARSERVTIDRAQEGLLCVRQVAEWFVAPRSGDETENRARPG